MTSSWIYIYKITQSTYSAFLEGRQRRSGPTRNHCVERIVQVVCHWGRAAAACTIDWEIELAIWGIFDGSTYYIKVLHRFSL